MATKRLKEKIKSNGENPNNELNQIIAQISDKFLRENLVTTINKLLNFICKECQMKLGRHCEYKADSLSYHEKSQIENNQDVRPTKRKSNEVASGNEDKICSSPLNLEKPKRKRKRRIYEPKGVKTSAAAHLIEQKRKKQTQLVQHTKQTSITQKLFRQNENEEFIDTNLEFASLNVNEISPEIKVDGYLPIHDAIANNLSVQFGRSLDFWQKRRDIDLNNCDLLLTDDDKDCLQLAVLHDSLPDIIKKLLDANFTTETFDDQYNSIIHLAILSDIQMISFNHLLNKTRWEILLERNVQGYTPLHLAVHENRFLHAEQILNKMDEIFHKKKFHSFPLDILVSDSNKQIEQFSKYYEEICMRLKKRTLDVHNEKRKLLDATETCSGRTALAVCIEYKLDHIAFLLLSHMADPTIENYVGSSPISYFNEFCKVNNLNLNVDNAMGNVKKLLYPSDDSNQTECNISEPEN